MRDVLTHALASETKLDVVQTQARGHATSLARQAVTDGLDLVVALGGDGTVNEVVNGLLADGPIAGLPALAVVPGGNANVFARALGLPASPVEATGLLLDALRTGQRRSVSLGQADDRWFTFCAGLGLDAEVVRRVEAKRAGGAKATPALFVREGVTQFFLHGRRSEPAITVHADGASPSGSAWRWSATATPGPTSARARCAPARTRPSTWAWTCSACARSAPWRRCATCGRSWLPGHDRPAGPCCPCTTWTASG
jgi:diacylglycerol kinase family enzyme